MPNFEKIDDLNNLPRVWKVVADIVRKLSSERLGMIIAQGKKPIKIGDDKLYGKSLLRFLACHVIISDLYNLLFRKYHQDLINH